MIKNTGLSISSVVAALLAASIVVVTTTISQFISIDVVKSAYAFPCKGGIGEEYCSRYHTPLFGVRLAGIMIGIGLLITGIQMAFTGIQGRRMQSYSNQITR
jgi:hypothetical protein